MTKTEVDNALAKLVKLGVISAPDYWSKTIEEGKLKYLDDLVVKTTNKITKKSDRTKTADEAVNRLVAAGVISAGDYWIKNKNAVPYLEDFLCALGGCFPAVVKKSPVDLVLDMARSQIGYLEKKSNAMLDSFTGNAGENNFTKYARDLDAISFYNGKKNGYPWCDAFCDWCFVKTFGVDMALKITGQVKGGLGASCKYSAQYYKSMNRYYTKNPMAGDQIFFKDKNGNLCHTGLIEKVEGGYIHTIEGNTSSAAGVVANGGSVNSKKYKTTYSMIAGYGRPNYDLVK